MPSASLRTEDLLIAIDNTLKDEAEARVLHDQSNILNNRSQRSKLEAVILKQTPNNLSDVASLLIAISEMIDRAEQPNLGAAVNAIGRRIHHETHSLVA